jgi:hypothetical protein
MTDNVRDWLARMVEDESIKTPYRDFMRPLLVVFEQLRIDRFDEALLFVIGQHAGACGKAEDLQAEVDRLRALAGEDAPPNGDGFHH